MTSRSGDRQGAASGGDAVLLDESDLDVLRLLAQGLSADVIGRRLGLSDRTVRRRLRSICDRVGVESPIQAVVWAVREARI